ncbi:helix-turn-helix domain-containing protein [Streptomyces sp. NBC_00223]|uniref:helix-turn-helix domain-containing protein n=1 Tax=Streptomyces sp. NBC_00223 TaxID=2976008 RepID=UPI003FA73DDC
MCPAGEIDKVIGRRIEAGRQSNGLLQHELAAAVGRSESWIGQVIRGIIPLDSLSLAERMAGVPGLTADHVLALDLRLPGAVALTQSSGSRASSTPLTRVSPPDAEDSETELRRSFTLGSLSGLPRSPACPPIPVPRSATTPPPSFHRAVDNRELATADSLTDILLWRLRHEAHLPAAPGRNATLPPSRPPRPASHNPPGHQPEGGGHRAPAREDKAVGADPPGWFGAAAVLIRRCERPSGPPSGTAPHRRVTQPPPRSRRASAARKPR